MKFAHIGDLHIGKIVNGQNLLKDQAFILNQMVKIFQEEKVDVLLVAGDVYDRSVPSGEALALFNDFLEKLDRNTIKTIIISGNHDGNQRLGFGSYFFEKSFLYLVTNYQKNPILLKQGEDEVAIYPIPYMNRSDLKEALELEELPELSVGYHRALENLERKEGIPSILVAHQFVMGTTPPSKDSSEELLIGGSEQVSSPLFESFDYVALGHIHRPEAILKDTGTIRYAGSMLSYSKAEANQQKSMPIFEITKEGLQHLKTIALKPLHEVYLVREHSEKIVSGEIPGSREDYYYFELLDEYFPFHLISQIGQMYPNYRRILPAEKKREASKEIDFKAIEASNPLEMIAQWYELSTNRSLSDEQQAWIKSLWEKGEME